MKVSRSVLLIILFQLISITIAFRLDLSDIKLKKFPKQFTLDQSNELMNITHYQFITQEDLKSNVQFNYTFKYFNENKFSYNTVWKLNSSLLYTIDNATPYFTCLDQNQTVSITNNNTIIFDNVSADLTLNFKWTIKKGNQSYQGKGVAKSRTNTLAFSTSILEDPNYEGSGFVSSKLLDATKIKISPFTLVKLQPEVTQSQKADLLALLNDAQTAVTIKELFDIDLQKKYQISPSMNVNFITSMSIYNKNYSYSWQIPYSVDSVYVVMKPQFFKIYPKKGIALGYIYNTKDLEGEQFTPIETPQYLPAQIYGGRQQFVSYQFYKNFLAYFIQQEYIAARISRDLWSTKNFRFYAHQLFEFFTNLNTTFSSFDEVVGVCIARDSKNISVEQSTNYSFYVNFNIPCQFSIKQKSVFDIDLALKLQVIGIPSMSIIDFWAIQTTSNPVIKTPYGFQLKNQSALFKIINDVVDKLQESKIMGSGWKLQIPQYNPFFSARKTGTYVTDLQFKPKI